MTWGRPIELVAGGEPWRPLPAEELARLGRLAADLRPRLERVVVLGGPRGFSIGRTTTAGDKVRAYREVVENYCGPTGYGVCYRTVLC